MNKTGGPGSIQGCVTDGYSNIRRNPTLRNASIDRIDSCSEVVAGLTATGLVTLLIWVIMVPFFDIAGLIWIRSWEGESLISLADFKMELGYDQLKDHQAQGVAPQEWAQLTDDQRMMRHFIMPGEPRVDNVTFASRAMAIEGPVKLNRTLISYAFERIDADGDGFVTGEELMGCLTQNRWHQCAPQETTVTTTTQEFVEETTVPVALPTVPPTPAAVVTTPPPVTAAPPAAVAPEDDTSGPGGILPSSITGPFVEVSLKVPGLGGEKLSTIARRDMANVFREDLAYAAGILSTEVMDVRGRTGCVFSDAAIEGTLDYHSKGCLALPAGATQADIEAVLVSHAMRGKIADDLTGVHNIEDRPVGVNEINLEVLQTDTCREATVPAGTIYCEDGSYAVGQGGAPAPAPTPQVTVTTTMVTTTTVLANPVAFKDFIMRMGSQVSGSARDSFGAVDASGDDIVTKEELVEAGRTKCTPPLSDAQSEDLFRRIDTDGNGQVAETEFMTEYTNAGIEPPPQPITMQAYKDGMKNAVHCLNVSLRIINNDQIQIAEDTEYPLINQLTDDFAIEAGVETSKIHSLDWAPASVTIYLKGDKITDGVITPSSIDNSAPLQVYTVIEMPQERTEQELVGVLNSGDVRGRFAQHLSALPNFGQVQADDVVMAFAAIPAPYALMDSDRSGGLNLAEFKTATQKFRPALTDEQASFVFNKLNQDANPDLTQDEFKAASLTEFSA